MKSSPMRAVAATLCLFGALFVFSACSEVEVEKIDAATYAAHEPRIDAASYTAEGDRVISAPIKFADVTEASGIAFTHTTGQFGQKWMPETIGSGVAIFDANGDDFLDVFLVDSTWWEGHEPADAEPGRCRLFLNTGGKDGATGAPVFRDVSEEWGADVSLYGQGVTAGDYDGDGDMDLFISAVGPNLLLRNDGDKFVDATAEAGVAGEVWTDKQGREHPEWSVSSGWLDYDLDGVLDLFVANYVNWSPENDVYTTLDGQRKSYSTPVVYEGQSCRLYRGLGDGTFEDVTEAAGVYNPSGKSMAVAFEDIDDDGFVDIFVTNDTQPNFLYLNLGNGTFEDAALAAGVGYDENGRARAGMGVDVADLANSGKVSIAIGNFSREPISLYELQDEGPLFLDVAGSWGVSRHSLMTLTFPLRFADLDADGYKDMLVGNGHLEPEINSVQSDIHFEQPMQVFCSVGGERFEELGTLAGEFFSRPLVSRGIATGDLDNDGDLDVIVTQNGADAVVLINESPGAVGRSIRVDVRDDTRPNTYALGAKVSLSSAPLKMSADSTMSENTTGAAAVGGKLGEPITQRRMVRTASSFMSQSELPVTFGLPAGHEVAQLQVEFPGGFVYQLDAGGDASLRPGTTLRIRRTADGVAVEELTR